MRYQSALILYLLTALTASLPIRSLDGSLSSAGDEARAYTLPATQNGNVPELESKTRRDSFNLLQSAPLSRRGHPLLKIRAGGESSNTGNKGKGKAGSSGSSGRRPSFSDKEVAPARHPSFSNKEVAVGDLPEVAVGNLPEAVPGRKSFEEKIVGGAGGGRSKNLGLKIDTTKAQKGTSSKGSFVSPLASPLRSAKDRLSNLRIPFRGKKSPVTPGTPSPIISTPVSAVDDPLRDDRAFTNPRRPPPAGYELGGTGLPVETEAVNPPVEAGGDDEHNLADSTPVSELPDVRGGIGGPKRRTGHRGRGKSTGRRGGGDSRGAAKL